MAIEAPLIDTSPNNEGQQKQQGNKPAQGGQQGQDDKQGQQTQKPAQGGQGGQQGGQDQNKP